MVGWGGGRGVGGASRSRVRGQPPDGRRRPLHRRLWCALKRKICGLLGTRGRERDGWVGQWADGECSDAWRQRGAGGGAGTGKVAKIKPFVFDAEDCGREGDRLRLEGMDAMPRLLNTQKKNDGEKEEEKGRRRRRRRGEGGVGEVEGGEGRA